MTQQESNPVWLRSSHWKTWIGAGLLAGLVRGIVVSIWTIVSQIDLASMPVTTALATVLFSLALPGVYLIPWSVLLGLVGGLLAGAVASLTELKLSGPPNGMGIALGAALLFLVFSLHPTILMNIAFAIPFTSDELIQFAINAVIAVAAAVFVLRRSRRSADAVDNAPG